jgi:riboflavin kinase/FMN adenylyltransferase
MPFEQRIERMLSMGVDLVFVQPFTHAYASREATEFLKSLQASFPGLKSVHIGENFRFGARRSGDVDTLTESGGALGIDVGILERENHGGEPISSSAIRTALGTGDISGVNAMLGSPYTIRGTIVPGKKVGRGLGFPTVNIPWDPEARPQFGVYAVTARQLPSGNILRGIANYGLRPTVDEAEFPLLEVHFLEGEPMPTTGDRVEVSLLAFIRPERKFPSKEELRMQIRRDVEEISKRGLRNGAVSPGNS